MLDRSDGAEVIIATTFREFTGSDNDLIQHKFLDSLANQSYKRFKLAVTVFKEKKVKDVVRSKKIVSAIYPNKVPVKNKFSLTDVLVNGIIEAELSDSSFLIWTTCDVVFPVDFLENVVATRKPGLMITSHPHAIAESSSVVSINTGFDFLGFDKKLFENPKFKDTIKKYKFYDWGLFEHFLIAVGDSVGSININLHKQSPVVKHENDRAPGKETQDWLSKCWQSNKKVFDKYLTENKITPKYYSLAFCHLRFAMKGFGLTDLKFWWRDYYKYYISRVKCQIGRVPPKSVKEFLRKFI
mgnify:CR=1 FL=1